MKKPKILFVIDNFEIGGVQKALLNLLAEIKDQYEIYVYPFSFTGCLSSQLPSSVHIIKSTATVRAWGLSQKQANQTGLLMGIYRGVLALFSKIFTNALPIWASQLFQRKLTGFDVAVAYMQNNHNRTLFAGPQQLVLNRVEAGQKVAFIHCDYLNSGVKSPGDLKRFQGFDRIACVSYGCLQNLLVVHPTLADKSSHVYNCYNVQELQANSDQEQIDLGVGPNFVMVTRLGLEKGLDRAIRVASRLVRQGYRFRLHLVGDGKQRKLVEALIEKERAASFIILHGKKANPYPYIAGADMLMVASYHEAAPLVIGEAKILKTPVLTTRHPSAAEQVKNGREGFVCENSEEALYATLKMVLDEPELLARCKSYLAGTGYSNQQALRQFNELLAGNSACTNRNAASVDHEKRQLA